MRWPQEEQYSLQQKTKLFSLKLKCTPPRTSHCHETNTSACESVERFPADPTCCFLWNKLGQCRLYWDQASAAWSPWSKSQTLTDMFGRQMESQQCLMRMRSGWTWAVRKRRVRCCKQWGSSLNRQGLIYQSLLLCRLWKSSVKEAPVTVKPNEVYHLRLHQWIDYLKINTEPAGHYELFSLVSRSRIPVH